MFGKSALEIQNYLLETSTEDFDPSFCIGLLRKSLKKKANDVVASIEGFQITFEQKERIKIIKEHFDDLDNRIARVDNVVEELVNINK